MNRLAFIVQGNKKIGHGHIFRCLRIANLLKKKYKILFFSINPINKTIKSNLNFSFKTITNLKRFKDFNLIIIDKLNNHINDIKFLSKNNTRLIIIDDMNNHKQNNVKSINYLYYKKNQTNNQIINDLRNFIPVFQNNKKKITKNVKKILIIQGSSDPHNNFIKIFNSIKKIIQNNKKINFYFHLGFINTKSLKYQKLKNIRTENSNLFLTSNIKNMSDYLSSFDLAITACGITALDLIYLKIPSIYITNENKENYTAKKLDLLKLGFFVGKMTIENKKKLYNILNNLIFNYKSRKVRYNRMNLVTKKISKKNIFKTFL